MAQWMTNQTFHRVQDVVTWRWPWNSFLADGFFLIGWLMVTDMYYYTILFKHGSIEDEWVWRTCTDLGVIQEELLVEINSLHPFSILKHWLRMHSGYTNKMEITRQAEFLISADFTSCYQDLAQTRTVSNTAKPYGLWNFRVCDINSVTWKNKAEQDVRSSTRRRASRNAASAMAAVWKWKWFEWGALARSIKLSQLHPVLCGPLIPCMFQFFWNLANERYQDSVVPQSLFPSNGLPDFNIHNS